MTDYFALLQRPRRPWLDPGELKEKYQELTLLAHPDRQRSNEAAPDFATITEAYRVLSDHKLRLQHLLRLQGHEGSSHAAVPEEFVELFSQVDTLLRRAGALVERASATQNALSKSLLRPEILDAQQEMQSTLEKLKGLHQHALQELRSVDDNWVNAPETAVVRLTELYRQFAYLGRWMDQLHETEFRLSEQAR